MQSSDDIKVKDPGVTLNKKTDKNIIEVKIQKELDLFLDEIDFKYSVTWSVECTQILSFFEGAASYIVLTSFSRCQKSPTDKIHSAHLEVFDFNKKNHKFSLIDDDRDYNKDDKINSYGSQAYSFNKSSLQLEIHFNECLECDTSDWYEYTYGYDNVKGRWVYLKGNMFGYDEKGRVQVYQ